MARRLSDPTTASVDVLICPPMRKTLNPRRASRWAWENPFVTIWMLGSVM